MWCSYTSNIGGLGSHTGIEHAEDIHSIITSAQKSDDVLLTLDPSLSTIQFGVIKIPGNIGILPSLCISGGVWA